MYSTEGGIKMEELRRRELFEVPFDKMFDIEGNQEELCHATGMEIQDECGEWWNEYVDRNGNFHYGR